MTEIAAAIPGDAGPTKPANMALPSTPAGMPEGGGAKDLRRCVFGSLFFAIARHQRLRLRMVRCCERLEGGLFFSATARRILERYQGVRIGAFSYGGCFIPGAFPAGVSIGRYVSIAGGVRVFLRNHPMDRLSMHPFFYNRLLGIVPADTITTGSLSIEHDSWVGENVIVTPGCHRIGLGAVVGAGAVVTKDVPDFAVVAGNPARLIRSRFADPVCELIRNSQWWLLSLEALRSNLDHLTSPLGDAAWLRSLAASKKLDGVTSGQAGREDRRLI
jgi:acetyltransferase-like isoleucine patch superfamily enzyme